MLSDLPLTESGTNRKLGGWKKSGTGHVTKLRDVLSGLVCILFFDINPRSFREFKFIIAKE